MSLQPGPGAEIGPYRLEAALGRGGMGVVFRAHDRALGRGVALKLLPTTGADPLQAARLRVEARAAAGLRHPGIVRILAAGVQGPQAWVAMELVDGEQLAERVGRAPLTPVQAVRVAADLADALAHAHARGVVHRDLKPHNVILQPDGRPVLIDFGLAKLLGRSSLALSVTGELLGTPGYMAPEQVDAGRGPIDARTDVYGLGATLYHLLTGAPPVRGESLLGQLQQVLHGEPDLAPVRAAAPGLEPVLSRCLAKAPAGRYASAAELRDALRAWLPAPRAEGSGLRAARAASLIAWVLPSAIATGGWAWSALRAPVAPPQTAVAPAGERARAERQLQGGIAAALAGDVAAARAAFEAAQAADPTWGVPLRLHGRWLVRIDPQQAIPVLRRVVELDPADGDAWQALALGLGVQGQTSQAHQALERGDALPGWRLRGAGRREDLERAVEEAPTSPMLHCLLGQACLAGGDLNGAERAAARSLELDPLAREALLVLAGVAEGRGDMPTAFARLARALRSDPHGSLVWAGWARLCRAAPPPPELVQELDPLGLGARLNLLEDEQDPQRAQELVADALRTHPQNRLVWLWQARSLQRAGRACECLAILARFHAREPRTASSSLIRAHARLHLADLARCVQDTDFALQSSLERDQRLEALLLRSEALLRQGQVDEAIEALNQAEAGGPLPVSARLTRGFMHLCLGAPREALLDLGLTRAQLAETDPLRAICDWEHELARTMLEQGETSTNLGRLAAALDGTRLAPAKLILERALRASPADVDALSLHGLVACALASETRDESGAPAAQEDLRRAVELDPRSPRAWGRRGLALVWAQDQARAESAALRAIALDPQQPEARLALAELQAAAGDTRAALRELEQCGSIETSFVHDLALQVRALVLLDLGHPAARSLLGEALKLRPGDHSLLVAHAAQLCLDEDFTAARAITDYVLDVNPDHPAALVTRGSLEARQGELEAARRDLDRAVRLAPSLHSWLGRAAVLAAQGDHRAALVDLDLAAASAPDDLQVLIRRSLSREFLGDREGARADLERARAIDPQQAAELERQLRR